MRESTDSAPKRLPWAWAGRPVFWPDSSPRQECTPGKCPGMAPRVQSCKGDGWHVKNRNLMRYRHLARARVVCRSFSWGRQGGGLSSDFYRFGAFQQIHYRARGLLCAFICVLAPRRSRRLVTFEKRVCENESNTFSKRREIGHSDVLSKFPGPRKNSAVRRKCPLGAAFNRTLLRLGASRWGATQCGGSGSPHRSCAWLAGFIGGENGENPLSRLRATRCKLTRTRRYAG
jgi:hypothetical protein